MKARIFEIKRFAVHDGDGIRTTVFFKGCPLRCVWCHNPEGLSGEAELAYFTHKCIHCGECVAVCPTGAHTLTEGIHRFDCEKCIACGRCAEACLGNALTLYGKEYTVEELLPILLKDKEFYDNSGGGVTLSGGECLLQADFCVELLKRLKENGVHTAVDTCGWVPKVALDKVLPYTDVFLYDVKAIDEGVHTACTGQGNRMVLDNLSYLNGKGAAVEIRVPFVPDFNDKEVEKMGAFLSRFGNIKKVRVLAYHNLAGSKYAALNLPNTLHQRLPTEEKIAEAKECLKRYNLPVV